jgi:hypothetical protein
MSLLDDRQGQLFDPDDYGPGHKPRQTKPRPEPVVEPIAHGWTYLRSTQGVLPFAHLVGGWTPERSVITLCGQVGIPLPEASDSMIRCVACDIAQQLA